MGSWGLLGGLISSGSGGGDVGMEVAGTVEVLDEDWAPVMGIEITKIRNQLVCRKWRVPRQDGELINTRLQPPYILEARFFFFWCSTMHLCSWVAPPTRESPNHREEMRLRTGSYMALCGTPCWGRARPYLADPGGHACNIPTKTYEGVLWTKTFVHHQLTYHQW